MADSRKRRFMGNIDESSSRKKFEVGNVQGYRFLIPSKAAGSMIGKGGEVIKRLRSEHSCRIIIPDSQGPERMVIIDADANTILNVWNDILPSIKEYVNAKDCDFKGSSNKYSEEEDEIDLRLLVHESQAGAVIGKGGERIRNLIDKHRMTMIKLYQTFCPNSTDRVVRLVSKLENVMACLENIFELLENQIIKGVRNDYNPDNYDESIAHNYGGFISKEGRFPARRPNNVPPGRNMPDNNYETGDFMPHPNSYPRPNPGRYEDGMAKMRPMPDQPNPMMERGGAMSLLDGVLRLSAVNDMNNIQLCRVAVPKMFIVAIVGRDSRRLMDIERDSGARIEMELDRMDGRAETVFSVSGAPDQIYKAQCLMQLCARKYNEARY